MLLRKAVVIAEAAVASEGDKKNTKTLMRLADAHFAAGNVAKAKEVAQQAIAMAPSEDMKRALRERMAEMLGTTAKDKAGK
jgi:Tetratricopeptide repeat